MVNSEWRIGAKPNVDANKNDDVTKAEFDAAAIRQMEPQYKIYRAGLTHLKDRKEMCNSKKIRTIEEFGVLEKHLLKNANKTGDKQFGAQIVNALVKGSTRVQELMTFAKNGSICSVCRNTNLHEELDQSAQREGIAGLIHEKSKKKVYECRAQTKIPGQENLPYGSWRCKKYQPANVAAKVYNGIRTECMLSFWPYRVEVRNQFREYKFVLCPENCECGMENDLLKSEDEVLSIYPQ